MTERSPTPDGDYDVTYLPDDEDAVYLIGVDPQATGRMRELIHDRFDELFEDARFIVFAAEVTVDDGLSVWSFTSNEIKDAIADFAAADDEPEAMVAINRMLPDDEEVYGSG